MKRTLFVLTAVFLLMGFVFSTIPVMADQHKKEAVQGEVPEAIQKDPRKQTTLGKYVTAREAFEKWASDKENVKIIDCRTPEEYVYVGHACMAYNIPSKFMTYKVDAEKKQPILKDNPDFVKQVQARFKPSDTILVMCRSGHRSAASVNNLAAAGFTNAYNITDGFEGDALKDSLSYFDGKRVLNGWKNIAPWSYALDPDLMYLSDEK